MTARKLDWSFASRAQAGQSESGDRCLVERRKDRVFVGAVDALGHGPEAARAAEIAIRTLRDQLEGGPQELLQRCHAGLRGTRGAAISLAVLDEQGGMMSWLGVGNVCGVLLHAETGRAEQLLVHAGVVGHKLPDLRPSRCPLTPGDVLVLATDGVRGHFIDMLTARAEPRLLAERILEKHADRNDDALVLVFRLGGGP